MYLPYLQRDRRWVIEVVYADSSLKRFGPFFDPEDATNFLKTRIADPTYTGPRRQDILRARVVRSQKLVDGSRGALVGVRFVNV